MKISAVIIAQNEEADISACIDSLSLVDEVVLVDDQSTDNTVTIAKGRGARVFSRKLDGFAAQKNFGISKASNDWVLIVDADERLTAELGTELSQLKGSKNIYCYEVARRNYIGRKWMRHGGFYPDYQIRLLHKGHARFGDKQVHERVEHGGKCGILKNDLIHYTYQDFGEYLAKVKRYSRLEAAEDVRRGEGTAARPLTAAREFARVLIKLGAFRDGWQGLLSAVLLGYYKFLYSKEVKRLRS